MLDGEMPILRRPRLPSDASEPIYALLDGRKFALGTDLVVALQAMAREFANLSDRTLGSVVTECLERDRLGSGHRGVLDGLLRQAEPWDGSNHPTTEGPPDSCDLCGRSLLAVGWVIDGCTTTNMLWSWMCPACFAIHGCGLGNGWGQLYGRAGGSAWRVYKGQ